MEMQETRAGVEGMTRREEGTKVKQAAEAATTDGGATSSVSRLLADLAGLRALHDVSLHDSDSSHVLSRRSAERVQERFLRRERVLVQTNSAQELGLRVAARELTEIAHRAERRG